MKNKILLILASFIIIFVTIFTVSFTATSDSGNPGNNNSSSSMTGSNAIYNDKQNELNSDGFDEDEKSDGTDDETDSSEDTSGKDSISESDSDLSIESKDIFSCFVSKKSIVKTKEKFGETTTFVLSFKLFVTNNSNKSAKLLSSGFDGTYDIKEFASLYSFECLETNESKLVEANETIEFDFSIKYIVTQADLFDEDEEFTLNLNYLGSDLISVLV